MRKIDIIISKYNVIPKIVFHDKTFKKWADFIAKLLQYISFVMALIDLIYFPHRGIVTFVVFLLMSISSAIYFSPYIYNKQYYAICKKNGCGDKIFVLMSEPPEVVSLTCRNGHTNIYEKEELKSYEIGIAYGPEETAYKSFRLYRK